MTRAIYISVFFLFFIITSHAQQQALFSQFAFNKLPYNPATLGAHEQANVTLINRNQWSGLLGAPKTQMLSYSSAMSKHNNAWGLQLQRHTIGIQERLEMSAFYGMKIPFLPQEWKWGLQFSARRYQMDFTDPNLIALDGFNQDPNIEQSVISTSNFNLGAGILYRNDNFFAGVSIPQILKNKLNTGNLNVKSSEVNHLYIMLGAKFELGEHWDYQPEFLFKLSENTPYNLDLLSMFSYQENLFLGLNIRSGGSQNAILESFDYVMGFAFTDKIFAGLSYDITVSELSDVENGSLELLLRYKFDKKPSIEIDEPLNNYIAVVEVSNSRDSLSIQNNNDSNVVLQGKEINNATETDFSTEKFLSGERMELKNIYYSFDSFTIEKDAANELDLLVEILKENTKINIRLMSYTDSQGDEEYNLELSNKRALSAKKYLVLNGIEDKRVIALGFGESQIRNHCSEGVKCTEEEHNYNRRTEVQIIN